MEMSSEFQYKMEVSWNPCDVIFFTPAGARSRCLGKKLVEMRKILIGFFCFFLNLWEIPEPVIAECSFSPDSSPLVRVPKKSLFDPGGCPFANP